MRPGRRGAARRGAGGHAAVRPGIGSFGGIFGIRRAVGEEHAVEHVVVGVGPVARIISVGPERVIEHVVVGVGLIDRAAPRHVRREQAKLPRRARRKPRRAPSGEPPARAGAHWRAVPTQSVPAWPAAADTAWVRSARGCWFWIAAAAGGLVSAAAARSAARRAGGAQFAPLGAAQPAFRLQLLQAILLGGLRIGGCGLFCCVFCRSAR